MNTKELDNFVFKFKELWKSDIDAHLDHECHAGQAWIGIRVRLGHAPGPHILPRRTRDGPIRQRRLARRAAAREVNEAEEANDRKEENEPAKGVLVEEAEKATEKQEESKPAEGVIVDEAARATPTDEVPDEFCPNEEYSDRELHDDNSETFRFIINDPALNVSLEAFENKLMIEFQKAKVEQRNQLHGIYGYEQLKNQSKLFIKVLNNPAAIAAVRGMKSEETLLRKLPTRKMTKP